MHYTLGAGLLIRYKYHFKFTNVWELSLITYGVQDNTSLGTLYVSETGVRSRKLQHTAA